MRFLFFGNKAVGEYAGKCLQAIGWELTDELESAEAAITYFERQEALEDAYFEDDGLIKRLQPGCLIMDLSPAAPSFSHELAAVAQVSGLRFVEAPLAVDDPCAEDPFADWAGMTLYVAGEADDLGCARPALDALAATVVETGPSGSAQLARAVRSAQTAPLLLSTMESAALFRDGGSALGFPAEREGLFAESDAAEHTLDAIGVGRISGSFTAEMLLGEVMAALAAADEADLVLPQLEAAANMLGILCIAGSESTSPAAAWLMYRTREEGTAAGLNWDRVEQLLPDRNDENDYGDKDGLEWFGDWDADDDWDDADAQTGRAED